MLGTWQKGDLRKAGFWGWKWGFLTACRKTLCANTAGLAAMIGIVFSVREKVVTEWLGREGSNLRMSVPKTDALPLGDHPIINRNLDNTSSAY